ncbi:hypothetical protein BJY01DRAFT_221469 [Aspergillus pseudoustus]|uniref:Uncharacterized protein n=1 Tax=Aspergillus pseudoustus TaxID=1810923 RepID=A0ABR4JAK2_9EURO
MSSVDRHADDTAEPPSLGLWSLSNLGADWDSEGEEEPSAKQSLAEQIRDIIEALKEIRSQLADQNKYLDVLAEKYIKPAPPQPPRVVYIDDEEWIEEIQPLQEQWHRSLIPDEERYQRIRDLFIDTLKEAEYSGLHISASSSTNRGIGSVKTLTAAWPVYREPPPQTKLGVTFDSEESLGVDFDTFFACCQRRRRGSHGESLHADQQQIHSVTMHETGYDSDALLEVGTFSSLAFWNSLAYKNMIPAEVPAAAQRAWSGRVCGRIISVSLEELPWIPIRTIAFVLWQLDNFLVGETVFSAVDPGWLCMTSFVSPWRKQEVPKAITLHDNVEVVTLYFQVRWMRAGTNGLYSGWIPNGIFLQRDQGDIPNVQRSTPCGLKIREERHGFAMITTVDRTFPLYTLVNITGGMPSVFEKTIDEYFDRNLQGMAARSYLRDSLTGLGVFLIVVSGTLERIAGEWISSLDQLDRTLHTSLAQMTHEKRQTLMFDSDFSKSDQYFAVLQTLYMCNDWVKRTLRDVKELCDNLDLVLSVRPATGISDRDTLAALSSAVVADSESQFHPLLERIERKVEEVKDLRDGLFNATSFKEASKGARLAEESRQQNRYFLVFTAAAIFYLPMRFVTPFFGMNIFDPNDDAAAFRTPFIIIFVVLSVATYVILTGGLLDVQEDHWIKTTLASWKLVAEALGIQPKRLTGSRIFETLRRKKAKGETTL